MQSPSRGCVGHRSLEYSKFADTQANCRLQYASNACARSLAPPHRHAKELRGAQEYGRRRTLGAVTDGRPLHHVVLAHRFAHKQIEHPLLAGAARCWQLHWAPTGQDGLDVSRVIGRAVAKAKLRQTSRRAAVLEPRHVLPRFTEDRVKATLDVTDTGDVHR